MRLLVVLSKCVGVAFGKHSFSNVDKAIPCSNHCVNLLHFLVLSLLLSGDIILAAQHCFWISLTGHLGLHILICQSFQREAGDHRSGVRWFVDLSSPVSPVLVAGSRSPGKLGIYICRSVLRYYGFGDFCCPNTFPSLNANSAYVTCCDTYPLLLTVNCVAHLREIFGILNVVLIGTVVGIVLSSFTFSVAHNFLLIYLLSSVTSSRTLSTVLCVILQHVQLICWYRALHFVAFDTFVNSFIDFTVPCCDMSFWHPFRGCRIGEASNPGPPRREICSRLCITNPTCIVNKHDYYHQIVQEHGVDLFTASETAATSRAQQVFDSQMSRNKFKILWSAPMEDQFSRSDGEQSLRGKASGTALISSLPCRAAVDTLDAQWFATGRLLHSVVMFGCLHVQVVVVYGLPHTRNNSSQLNSTLFLEAIHACSKLPLPFVIAGDFNVDPFSLECADTLYQLGLKDLVKLSSEKFGKTMTPTCKDTTIADNALISADLVPFLSDIRVCPQQYFDTHRPVFVDFAFPSQGVFDTRLKQPKSWIELDLDDDLFPEAYHQAVDSLGRPSTIEEWGQVIECTVDKVYREQQQKAGTPLSKIRGLPKRYRGRCMPPKFEKVAVKSLTPVTRPGDYAPPGEIYDFATRKKVIHMRRLQSFLRRYQKQHHLSSHLFGELIAEWDAILRDRSWGITFLLWCQTQPELGPPGYPLPAFDYVFTLYQLTKYYTDAEVKSNQTKWQQRRQLSQHWDAKQGSAKAFAKMKQNFRPPVSELRVEVSDSVHIAPTDNGQVSVFSSCPLKFSSSNLVYLDDIPCSIKQVDDYSLTVMPHAEVDFTKESCELKQQCVQHAPQEIFGTLTRYWQQFWHRSDTIGDPSQDDFLQALLQNVPKLDFPDIQCLDVSLWLNAIKDIKPTAARGG